MHEWRDTGSPFKPFHLTDYLHFLGGRYKSNKRTISNAIHKINLGAISDLMNK